MVYFVVIKNHSPLVTNTHTHSHNGIRSIKKNNESRGERENIQKSLGILLPRLIESLRICGHSVAYVILMRMNQLNWLVRGIVKKNSLIEGHSGQSNVNCRGNFQLSSLKIEGHSRYWYKLSPTSRRAREDKR